LDFCGANFFAGLFAGHFLGLCPASFDPAKSPAKGTVQAAVMIQSLTLSAKDTESHSNKNLIKKSILYLTRSLSLSLFLRKKKFILSYLVSLAKRPRDLAFFEGEGGMCHGPIPCRQTTTETYSQSTLYRQHAIPPKKKNCPSPYDEDKSHSHNIFLCDTCNSCWYSDCLIPPMGWLRLVGPLQKGPIKETIFKNCMQFLLARRLSHSTYGVATMSRMLKHIGLFCKRALQKRPIFCKETYIFKHPTNRSLSRFGKEDLEIFRFCWYVRIDHFVVHMISLKSCYFRRNW